MANRTKLNSSDKRRFLGNPSSKGAKKKYKKSLRDHRGFGWNEFLAR